MTTATTYDLTSAVLIYARVIAPLHQQYLSEDNAGGKMRASMGDLYEDVAQAVIYAVDPSIVCKHNDYIMIESKGGKSSSGPRARRCAAEATASRHGGRSGAPASATAAAPARLVQGGRTSCGAALTQGRWCREAAGAGPSDRAAGAVHELWRTSSRRPTVKPTAAISSCR